MADTALPSAGSTSPHVIRCAECRELVPADRVQHREERVKVAASPTPGRWRSGGPPIFRAPDPGPRIGAGSRPRAVHPAPPPRNIYIVERIPVCVDCLRRQRMGLLAACGIAATCVVVALILYSQDSTAPRRQQIALLTPPAAPARSSAGPTAAAAPQPRTAAPPPVWAPATPSPPSSTAALAPSVGPDAAAAPSAPAPGAQPSSAPSDSEPPAPSAIVADASPAAAPIWAEHTAPARRPGAPASSRRAAPPSASALALRKDGYTALERRRYGEALSLLQQATLMGDAYAPMYIGQLFEGGIGVPRDVGQASYWYGIAIRRGNAMALAAFNRMRVSPY